MEARAADRRVGYFTSAYIVLGSAQDEQQQQDRFPSKDGEPVPLKQKSSFFLTEAPGVSSAQEAKEETDLLFDSYDQRKRLIHRRRINEGDRGSAGSIVYYIGESPFIEREELCSENLRESYNRGKCCCRGPTFTVDRKG